MLTISERSSRQKFNKNIEELKVLLNFGLLDLYQTVFPRNRKYIFISNGQGIVINLIIS